MCACHDYMESRLTLPQSKDIAPELTNNQHFDLSAMPSPPQGPLHDDDWPSEKWQEWRNKVRFQAKDEKQERKALKKIESEMMTQKARAFIQRLFANKQRAAGKMIKGNSSNQKLTAPQDQEREICLGPGDLTKGPRLLSRPG